MYCSDGGRRGATQAKHESMAKDEILPSHFITLGSHILAGLTLGGFDDRCWDLVAAAGLRAFAALSKLEEHGDLVFALRAA